MRVYLRDAKGKRNMTRMGTARHKYQLQFNDNEIFYLFFSFLKMLQKRWHAGPALDQKGRKRIGQLSNGIDLTTQQVQQIPTERLPLDEQHS